MRANLAIARPIPRQVNTIGMKLSFGLNLNLRSEWFQWSMSAGRLLGLQEHCDRPYATSVLLPNVTCLADNQSY